MTLLELVVFELEAQTLGIAGEGGSEFQEHFGDVSAREGSEALSSVRNRQLVEWEPVRALVLELLVCGEADPILRDSHTMVEKVPLSLYSFPSLSTAVSVAWL